MNNPSSKSLIEGDERESFVERLIAACRIEAEMMAVDDPDYGKCYTTGGVTLLQAAKELDRLRRSPPAGREEDVEVAPLRSAPRVQDVDGKTPLLPCPFCGCAAVFDEVDDEDSPDFGGHFVRCTRCLGNLGLQFANKDDPHPLLTERWNRRNDLSAAMIATIDRLREALEEISDAHLGDCPAAQEPTNHARTHIQYLRGIARDALAKAPEAVADGKDRAQSAAPQS